MKKADNSTFRQKVALREKLLDHLDNVVVMETHGGFGKIYKSCYSHVAEGVVFEKNPEKTAVLAQQRPHWQVYEADCVRAIAQGAGKELEVNFLDIDPYGEPWYVIDAFFQSSRPFPDKLGIAVNDGLRRHLKIQGGWQTFSMRDMILKYGNGLHDHYLEVCQELLTQKASQRGYSLALWAGYYCGHAKRMTHYAAILEKDQ